MSFDLCQVSPASNPYLIETIGVEIRTIEELCYHLHENVYLVDSSIINEKLCDWIRDELGLKRLYRILYEQLEKGDISGFITSIFREIGYLNQEQSRLYLEKIGRLEVQPADMKQKLKGDYLVRCGMFSNAVSEYQHILDRQVPGSLGTAFYSEIWNNLGCALARMFRFEEAADCFLNAWQLTHTRKMLRSYVSVLPLYLPEDVYKEKLKALGADSSVIGKIQEYNLKVANDAARENELSQDSSRTSHEMLEQLKEEYRRSRGNVRKNQEAAAE